MKVQGSGSKTFDIVIQIAPSSSLRPQGITITFSCIYKTHIHTDQKLKFIL